MSDRPHRIGDFRAPLEGAGVLGDTLCLGSYQMNHLCLITLRATEAKRKLLAARELLVKEIKCYILDPNQAEFGLKVHCISHHVPDDTVRKALRGFGRVCKVRRDVWRGALLEYIASPHELCESP